MHVIIDGKTVRAGKGETILNVARRAGISIPTLCHDDKLVPYASCWICVVKVKGEKRLRPACATRVSEGMEITTDDEDIFAVRRLCVELLLSDHCGECLPPCRLACPAGCDARGYLSLILGTRYDDALRLIRETVPFPATIGRICPHPCEEACRRNVVDTPAAICALKRFAADNATDAAALPEKEKPSGKRIAIIGSGPAGLSAAYFLALGGHSVTIFEAREKPGGMLRYGIPEYRLPKKILDHEIALIERLGVSIHCGVRIGESSTIPQLLERGHDAVLVAVGAQRNRRMCIAGEDNKGVLSGIDFLADVAGGRAPRLGSSVIVVGGGDTAIDAARTSLRLGAEKVRIVYRRSREEMPASSEEISTAEEEGIEIKYLTLPLKIARADGQLQIACSRMALGEPDESGRRKPIPIPGSEHAIPCDSIIMAIGQSVDTSVLNGSGLPPTDHERVGAAESTLQTGVDAVFAAGDCVTGPDIAVSAVAAGRRAAVAIDSFLRTGKPAALPQPFSPVRRENKDILPDEYSGEEKIPRATPARLTLAGRKRNFTEVEKTIEEEDALRESYRCLECGCEKITDCTLRDLAERYGISVNRFGAPPKRWENDERHPYIVRDPDKCIKCARCIRVCLEVQAIDAWGYIGRGLDMQVAPPFGWPLQDTACESCGQCLTACPTGALVEKLSVRIPPASLLEKTNTTCAHCGVGCQVVLHGFGNTLLKVTPRDNGNLCEKGKFKFAYLTGRDRLIFPMVREGRKFIKASLKDAAARVRDRLTKISPREIAVFVSPRLTNEEAYEAQKLARTVFRTNNIYPLAVTPIRRHADTIPSRAAREVEESDAIVLLDPRAVSLNGVAMLSIVRAVREGARLLIVGRAKTKLDTLAWKKLPVDPDRFVSYSKKLDSFIGEAKRPAIVYNRDCVGENTLISLCRLAGKRKARTVSLSTEINEQGLLDAGVSPFLLPGQRPLTNSDARKKLEKKWKCKLPSWKGLEYDALISTMKHGRIKVALFLGGVQPGGDREFERALMKVGFVVMQALAPTSLTRLAHVLLPAASWAESSGSFTRYDGKKLVLEKALPPLCGYSNLEIWRAVLG